jgi:protein-disulfide isomerase
MHDQLFGNQDAWVNLSKDDAIAKYGEYATAIGLNKDKLVDCVKTEKFGKEVDADIALAGKVGADGTPTFFIDKEMIVGAQPTTAFEAALDKALAQ